MTKYTSAQTNEALLAQSLFDLAEEYKMDDNLIGHLSDLCFRLYESFADSQNRDASRSVDWQAMSDYFDQLEFNKSSPALHSIVREVHQHIEKVLFEAKVEDSRSL